MNTSGTTLDPDVPKKKLTKESFRQGLRIFRFTLPYRTKFIIGTVLLTLSSASTMAFPWLIGKLADPASGHPVVLPNGVAVTINQIALGFAVLILLQGLFSFGRIWLFTQVSEFTVRDIRQALYRQFVSLPIPYFEKNRVGAITSRITERSTARSHSEKCQKYLYAFSVQPIATLISRYSLTASFP